ncbi:MAG TPA: EfeM/EfeO family lipoprotein [Solirubrobacterales bacterium]|nr:EfeM/EfeO family lipoprotein [Solirubrobacterales bacterium]
MDRVTVHAALVVALGLVALCLISCGSSEPSSAANTPQSAAAIEQYRSYLSESAADLVVRVRKLAAQIKAGELEEAQSSYAAARVPYGQLKPAAESLFGSLASRIDANAGDVPAGELTGLHRIEAGLWEDKTAAMASVSEQLLADAKKLQRRLKTADLRRTQIIDSANEVLEEASATAAHGGKDPQSRIDLVDVGANVEGVEAAFDAVKPPIEGTDSDLTAEIEARFKGAYTELRNFGRVARRPDQLHPETPGSTFVLYGERTQTEYNELAGKIDALSEGISQGSELFAP